MITINGKVLWVAGGRDYEDTATLRVNLQNQDADILITGSARGCDLRAESIWRKHHRPYVGIPAEWDRYARAAGHIRNERIAELLPDKLLVFPGGRGTQDAIRLAEEYNIEVERAVPYDG